MTVHRLERAAKPVDEGSPQDPQRRLVAALCAAGFRGTSPRPRVLETHISYVVLTGGHAYKIKKAVRMGFLDFSTLALRRFYCEQELRLNRRLAPALYLDVVAITGTPDHPTIGGDGPVIEYAVKMREFAQDALLSSVLAQDALTPEHVGELAEAVAQFHDSVGVAAANGPWGRPDDVLAIALQNFSEVRPRGAGDDLAAIDALDAWTRREFAARRAIIAERRKAGFVRECHGDLHLGNIALVDGALTVFDCIEFNEAMRWIDVMSEVAFTVMDLEHRGRPRLAFRFLNAYLEASGDYAGAGVLRFYVVYRAMVRAKVACLRADQLPAGPDRAAFLGEYRDCLRLARKWAAAPRAALVVTHGFAGSGKTVASQALLEHLPAIRIRTDVERKRLHGLRAIESSRSGVAGGLYAAEATRATYHYVASLALAVIGGDHVAIVDATNLARWQRDVFRDLAAQARVPFALVDVVARPATLRARVARRSREGGDASEADVAVLAHQQLTDEPLAADERDGVVACDGERPLDDAHVPELVAAIEAAVRAGPAKRRGGAVRGRSAPEDHARALAFLRRPDAYADASDVADIETHMSWVFLTDRHAYKLKKPVRVPGVDLRGVAARLRNAVDEVRLNRRLAADVYLGIVPLTRDTAGRLALAGDGAVVDWLVKMRRLRADRMLDRRLREGSARPADALAIVERLCDFYRAARPVGTTTDGYVREFRVGIAAYRRELQRATDALDAALIEDICRRQRLVLAQTAVFDARIRAGRIVEGHGDLRPEHVALEGAPQIIDCLEFSRALRTLDPADEVGYLALECERLEAPGFGGRILDAYRERCDDPVPDALVHFYQSYRACVRAMLSIRHLRDPAQQPPTKWVARANRYLELARDHAADCAR